MDDTTRCPSCSMPIAGERYCRYCRKENGNLQDFEARFERMVQWVLSEEPSLSRPEAERRTRAYMRTMPVWAGHPRLKD